MSEPGPRAAAPTRSWIAWAAGNMVTGLALALLAAIGMAGKSVVAKLMYGLGADAVTVMGLRMLMSLPAFVFMAWWGSRGQPALTAAQWRVAVLLGVSGYLSGLLDFMGLQYVSVGLERLIIFLMPTLVLLLSAWRFGHPLNRLHGFALGVSYFGTLLLFGHETSAGSGETSNWLTFLGATLVFASAAFGAVYITYSAELVRALQPLRLTGIVSLVACGLSIAQLLLTRLHEVERVPEDVWWLSAVNAGLCTVLPALAMMMAVQRIGAPLLAQSSLVGTVMSIYLAAVLLAEPLSHWVGVSTLLVVAGVLLLARANAGSRPRS
jgi:drug/metabolite transporter (DMT)-like permease